MKNVYLVLTILLFITINIFSAPRDTGYILWEQPNEVTFTARSWGDEFKGWMETDDGYRIVIGPDHYFYYAILHENGGFTYSTYKVGIDEPLESSYHLERSTQRLAEIDAEIEAFKQQLETNYIDFMAKFDGPSTPPLRLAIVLVDFADNLHSDDYYKEDFDTLFFSTDYYFTGHGSGPRSPWPDEEWVYGSLRDYYRDQSLNKLEIKGKFDSDRSIINPEDPINPGKPLWVYMPEERIYYEPYPKATVMDWVKDEAESQLLNIDLDQYDAIGFIYAGDDHVYAGGSEAGSNGEMFTSSERYRETFAHIGIPAHEFAHTLGAADEYKGNQIYNHPMYWSLMAFGSYNGGDDDNDNSKGSCPSSLSPAYRIMFNWVAPVEIDPQEDLEIQYNYSSPTFYKINIPLSSEYFIIERRRKDGYDLFTPQYEDPGQPPKGILIWHMAPDSFADGDMEQLEPANNHYRPNQGARFPLNSIQDFTVFTSPSSNKRNGDNSFISIKNIEWIGDLETGYAKLDYIFEALEITGTQTWSTNMSLELPVFIKDGGTLNITNGAYVHINGDIIEQVKFVVEDGGTFNLTGSENNNVVILSGDFEQPIEEWGGIEIFGSGTLVSNFSRIQDAMYPIQMFQDNATCLLNNTVIVDNKVSLRGNVVIENSLFVDASLYMDRSNNGSKIIRTIFSSELPNELYVQLFQPDVSYLEVTNCTFSGMNYGLQFGVEDPTFGDRTNQIIVRNNIFSDCDSSIEIYDGIISISYNDFYNNNYDNFMGSNYLTVNPLYVDPDNHDFNLQWGSGCIDAGHTSPVYNDPDGTRNDMGAKYYDQTPVIPTNFTVTPTLGNYPLLQWDGALHLDYKVYALYEYYDSTSANNEYTTLTESYVDQTVVFVEPWGQRPNQYATYSVTSINSLDEESEHTEEITIDAFGRLPKESLIDASLIPVSYNLFNPFPNPFNPTSTVIFDLPEKSFVSIKLYSITGEEVRTIVNEQMEAGRYPFIIDGNGLSSGVYFLRMVSNNFVSTKKLIMMK